jgi:sodium-coupled neutral amino acid transporter 11
LLIVNAHPGLEFDLDSEDIEDGTYVPTVPDEDDRRMPLLVGLLDSTHIQRSQDGSMLLTSSGQSEEEVDEELEGLIAKGKNGGGMLDSIANMANSILGAGWCRFRLPLSPHSPSLQESSVSWAACPLDLNRNWRLALGLPYAMSQAGFVTGIFLLVVLCIATDWTIRLIVINAKLSGRNSYIEIMHNCYGSSGRAAVSFFQFAFAFGGAFSSFACLFFLAHGVLKGCARLVLS